MADAKKIYPRRAKKSSGMFRLHKHKMSNHLPTDFGQICYKLKPSLMSQHVDVSSTREKVPPRSGHVSKMSAQRFFNSSRLSCEPKLNMSLVNELKAANKSLQKEVERLTKKCETLVTDKTLRIKNEQNLSNKIEVLTSKLRNDEAVVVNVNNRLLQLTEEVSAIIPLIVAKLLERPS